jgi:hypothetical protein
MIEKLYGAIEHYGRYYRIYEMFESHTGWLWFTLEMFWNQPDLRYGLVCGREREFGYFSMKDMNPLTLTNDIYAYMQSLGFLLILSMGKASTATFNIIIKSGMLIKTQILNLVRFA